MCKQFENGRDEGDERMANTQPDADFLSCDFRDYLRRGSHDCLPWFWHLVRGQSRPDRLVTAMQDWRCAGCGKPSSDRVRNCDCVTSVVFKEGGGSEWKKEPPEMTPERHALLWVFDRLSADNLSKREIAETARQIGQVLLGKECTAATYLPNDWDDSHRLTNR